LPDERAHNDRIAPAVAYRMYFASLTANLYASRLDWIHIRKNTLNVKVDELLTPLFPEDGRCNDPDRTILRNSALPLNGSMPGPIIYISHLNKAVF
jgi:hypothetical protein